MRTERQRRSTGKKQLSRKCGPSGPAIAETEYASGYGKFTLKRYPLRSTETLRAWDAADAYCLDYVVENELLKTDQQEASRVLVFNDSFGALSLPLHLHKPGVILDSCLSRAAINNNLASNYIDATSLSFIDSIKDLTPLYPKGVDVVLLKIPKSNAMLDYQLHQLRPLLREHSVVIAAGMTRHIHNSTMDAFAGIIGPTHSTLAKKKARLIISQLDVGLQVPDCEFPKQYDVEVQTPDGLETQALTLVNHAAVFSASKLDLGTQLFLQHLPVDLAYHRIIDLGCGNGILGIMAAMNNTTAELVFTDESLMAVDSARLNFHERFGRMRHAEFLHTDCLLGVEEKSADLILCNPPFHQSHIITDSVAWRMFCESRDVLRRGGELWVIGNRHLGYHSKLKHLFGNCETIASDRKFSLIKAVKKSTG